MDAASRAEVIRDAVPLLDWVTALTLSPLSDLRGRERRYTAANLQEVG